ncbi:MAG: RNA 2',3'-cyclic phosphodiesterase [Parvularculaceae bacterium]
MARVFVALGVPDDVRDALMDLQTGLRPARWVDADNFHLTLTFIGEVDRRGAEDLASALADVDAPPFKIELVGCGYFGDKRPHAVWAAVAPNPALDLLQMKTETAARRAGLEPDRRRFTPHVTLAYLSGAARGEVEAWRAERGLFRARPVSVDAFHLYRSHLGRGGARYEILETFEISPLG